MGKAKFRYDGSNLTFEKVVYSKREKLSLVSRNFLIVSAIAIAILVIASFFVESPTIKRLISKQDELRLKYEVLDKSLQDYKTSLNQIAFNDDKVYRVYFETDAIPSNVRNSGFGGANKYEPLEGFNNSDIMINVSKQMDMLEKQLRIQMFSFDDVIDMAMNKEKLLEARPAIQPISLNELKRFGSKFGMRVHPILGIRRMHEGIDLTAAKGTKIYATASGTVLSASYTTGGYGKKIVIDHGYGYKTLYAHCSKLLVTPGQKVKRGDVIGLVGNTGLSQGDHLHYEVHHNGHPVNPINYYASDLSSQEYDKMIEMLADNDQNFDIN